MAKGLLPDGVGGYVIEAPCGTCIVDEGLAWGVGGLDDGVAYATGTLLWEGEVFS